MAITITLNGVEVSGHPGMTILQLAQESGVHIPTLCHDPHLAPYGACRVCLVEDERNGALLASCVAPIAPGMVINTRSPKVIESRKIIVKLMLASHPDSCMVCDKGNRCQLRQIAADLGIGLIDLHRIPHPAAMMDLNPFIERDLSKCILCAKCIRADQELVCVGAIDYFHRGFPSRPATVGDTALEASECTFCGTCVALCPTGALSEKIKPYRGTTKSAVATVCPFCGCGCNLDLEIAGGRVVRAVPSGGRSPNGATACVRGSYGYDFIHSSERLTRPLMKSEGQFKPVSWEEAIGTVARRFGEMKSLYGSDSLAVLGSSRCTNEEDYLLQKFARAVIGTNNVDNGGRLYNAAGRLGLMELLGLPGSTNPIEDIEESGVILLIGADPEVSAPVLSYAVKRAIRKRGAKLIVINPWPITLARMAHLRLCPRSGTDGALVGGLLKVILDEDLWNKEFVSERVKNLDDLKASLKPLTLAGVEKASGVGKAEIESAARFLAGMGPLAVIFGTGVTQQADGIECVKALVDLALLTGSVGRRGGGLFPIQMDCNGMGASDMGCLPDFLPGYQSVADPEARRKVGQAWGVRLPEAPGLSAIEMIEKAASGVIRGMYIVGENPAVSFPGTAFVRGALANLEFLVVQDLFLTETARHAHVVLPAAGFAEKDGTFTNLERRVQRLRKAISPPGEAMPDGEIIARISSAMGYPMRYSSAKEILGEIAQTVPLYQGIDDAALEAGGIFWPRTDGSRWGQPRLYESGFGPEFGRLASLEIRAAEKVHKDGFKFELLAGRVLYKFGSGVRTSRSPRLAAVMPEPFLDVHPADASKLGIAAGDRVKVISRSGEITLRTRFSETVLPGMVIAPISFPESPVRALFDVSLDPGSRSPLLQTCRVKIEKV